MIKTLSKLIAFAATLFLIGCATGPTYTDMASSIPQPSPDMGRIYIYRTAVMGAAIQPTVKLNGEAVGKAVAQGFFYVDRPAGNYEIQTSTEVTRKLSLTLEPNQTRYVRLGISIGFLAGHVYPELVDAETGLKELKACKYTGPK